MGTERKQAVEIQKITRGKITVIRGPMFSEKTGELARQARIAELSERSWQVLRPAMAVRDEDKDEIRSRDGRKSNAISIDKPSDIIGHLKPETRIVLFDEAQFFGQTVSVDEETERFELDLVVNALAENGIEVFVAGLPLDFRGETFGPMGRMLAMADDIIDTKAVCTEVVAGKKCGTGATRTQRFIDGNPASYHDPVVQVGDTEAYTARCPGHWRVEDVPENQFTSRIRWIIYQNENN